MLSFSRTLLGRGWEEARTRERELERRRMTEGKREKERGVISDGRRRVAIRWNRREGTERPRGDSLK